MNDLISPRFVHSGLTVGDTDALLATMADTLVSAGRVRDSFRRALIEREAAFPTGLPVGTGVAIPHTDPEHVLVDTIAIATLARPVTFGEMGGDGTVEVRVVFLLALTATGDHLRVLRKVVLAIQDDAFLRAMQEAGSASAIADLARAGFRSLTA